jgi:drug/metabolite transporter (DMT)-like permease
MVVSTVLGILLFAESLTFLKILGSALIMIAVVSIHWKNSAFEQNHLYALLAGLLFGFVYSLDKAIVVQTSPLIYLFWGFLWIGLIGLLFNLKESLKNLREKPFKSYRPLFVSGLGYFLYNIFTFSAYAVGGEVGRIDAINNSQVFLIILFEFFILRQRESTVRNLLTALLAFAGVAILGFF